jgi:autotransporter-associated beta strand protein
MQPVHARRRVARVATLSALALSLAARSAADAAIRYWYPSAPPFPTAAWNGAAVWNTAANGTGTAGAWAANDDASFSQSGTYTVSVGTGLAGTTSVNSLSVPTSGANVTLDFGTGGQNVGITGTAGINVASGATLNLTGTGTTAGNTPLDGVFRSGTTPLTVNGTLNATGGAGSGRLQTISGSGTIKASTASGIGFRIGAGTYTFSGNLEDFDPNAATTSASRGRINFTGNNGAFDFTLSGDNSKWAGAILVGVANSTLRLGSATALGSGSHLRLEATNTRVELRTDLTRVWDNAAVADGLGGMNWGSSTSGFFATDADRTLKFVTALGSSTLATVKFGEAAKPLAGNSTIGLSHATATHKLTLMNDVDINGAARTVDVPNGAASVDAELSGAILNSSATAAALNKIGDGGLLLSGSNASVPVNIGLGASSANLGFARVLNSAALGGTPTSTINGNGATGRGYFEFDGAASGGITTARSFVITGRAGTDFDSIVNTSGNNSITGTVSVTSGGAEYSVRSNAGTLTLANVLIDNAAPGGARNFYFNGTGTALGSGAGNFVVTGSIGLPSGNTSTDDSVIKNGAGTLELRGASTFGGTTGFTVNAGTVLANNTTGSATGQGFVLVKSGATLGGSGFIDPTGANVVTIDSGAFLAPGNSIDSLDVLSDLALNGTLVAEVTHGATPLNADLLAVTGSVSLGAGSVLSLPGTNTYSASTAYTLLTYTGSLTGTFAGGVTGLPASHYVDYGVIVPNAITLQPIPEPTTLFALGTISIVALRRRGRPL